MQRESDRWADLDARLRTVETRLGMGSAGQAGTAPAGDGTLWVLDGLRDRLAGVTGGGIVLAGTVETAGGPAEWQYGRTTEALLDVDESAADTVAARLSALGHPVRLRLLLAVLRGHTSPAGLAQLDGMGTTGQVYHHIRILTAAGWLQSAGRGLVQVPAERTVPLLVAITTAL